MRVGVIGAGQVAKIHCPIMMKHPDTTIVGIADKDIGQARVLASQLNVRNIYDDVQLMIREQKPDIVHVLTPPHSHAELSIMAMDHGCHVLVEKPMALTMADAEKMVRTSADNRVKLCVNHNFVFADVFHRAIHLVSKGAIGEVISVEVCYAYDARRNPGVLEEGAEYCHWSYRLDGGLVQDLLPHPASLIFEFIPEITEVQCIAKNRGTLPKGWHDEIRASINSTTVTGYISISLNQRPDSLSMTIVGTRGLVEANLYNNLLTLQTKSRLPRALDRGLSGLSLTVQNLKGSVKNIYNFITGRVDKSNGIETIITRFYDSIRTGSEPPVSLEKSLRVVDLMCKLWPVPASDTKNTSSVFCRPEHTRPAANILVTGASGFIGTHLVNKLLAENEKVRALILPNSRHAGRMKMLDAEIIEGDVGDPRVIYEASKGVRTIYHAASAWGNDWEEHARTTIKGTENLINAALAHNVERFVFLSSLAVYELLSVNKRNGTVNEDSPYQNNPRRMGPYAYSKIEAEKKIFDAYHKHGLPVTVLRPGIVVGPMGRVFFPHLGYRYQDRIFLLVGNGDTVLPLTYVGNTVDGIYEASINDKAVGQVYNLVDDGDFTPRRYLQEFINQTGIQARIIPLPYAVPYLATTVYEIAVLANLIKHGVTSRAQLQWKHARVRFDNTKAKTELGWEPTVALKDGIKTTFAWYKSKHGSNS